MKILKRIGVIMSVLIFMCCLFLIIFEYINNKDNKGAIEELQQQFALDSEKSVKKCYKTDDVDNNIKDNLIADKFQNLYEENNQIIGWISIDNTKLNYPVMQTDDNEYYLNHNFQKETDRKGLPFLDKRCDWKNKSTNLIIYAHNQKDGSRFGSLLKYKEKEYYEEHRIINFDTLYNEAKYEIAVVFVSKVYNKKEKAFKYYEFTEFENEKMFNEFNDNIRKMSLYDTKVTLDKEDELLVLSTCEYSVNDGRFVVVARKIQ